MKWLVRNKTVIPQYGVWEHIVNLGNVADIVIFLKENMGKHSIEVITICRKDIRKWVFHTQRDILAFQTYLRNNVGTDDLKLRARIKELVAVD